MTQRVYTRALMLVAVFASIATSYPASDLERDVVVTPGVLAVDSPILIRRFHLATSVPEADMRAKVVLSFAITGPNQCRPDVPVRITLSAMDAMPSDPIAISPVVVETVAKHNSYKMRLTCSHCRLLLSARSYSAQPS